MAERNIVERGVIAEAFTGRDLGYYGLKAFPTTPVMVEEPLHPAPQLASRFVLVGGCFLDRVGRECGAFECFLYRHSETDELEVWLNHLRVNATRRGGLAAFRMHALEELRRAGCQRARSNGGGVAGSYVLAREGFRFDQDRLPGFGAGLGLAEGDEDRPLPTEGDLVDVLARRLVAAAVADGRISPSEAETVVRFAPRTPSALTAFPEKRLSKRLLETARYPQVREL